MPGLLRKITSAAAATALLASPTTAFASSRTAATPSASANWAMLSAMSSASSSSAALAAAQGDYAYRDNRGIPLPVIAVLAATIGLAIWILVHDEDDGDVDFGIGDPLSPD